MGWREQFDSAQTPQSAASALRLLPVYNVYQPAYAIGNIVYASTTGALAQLAPHTAATQAVMTMTGTGTAGQAPGWTVLSEAIDDRVDALIQDGTGLTWTYDDGANTLTGNVTITQYTDEMAQDAAATIIQNGTGITWSYNDSLNTLTPTVTITQYTDELAQDAIGGILVDTASINFTYNDATPSIVADVIWTSPGTIGSGTPNTGAFTTLTASGAITGTNTVTSTRSGAEAVLQTTRTDTHGDAATLGEFAFFGIDSGAASQKYAGIVAKSTSDNAGAEEGRIEFSVVKAGAVTEILSITGTVIATTFAISGATVAGAMVATQANMEAGTATNLLTPPGRQHFHPGHPKAWAYITVSGGTPTLAANFNITSIADTATGVVGVTIATDFSSAAWAGVVTADAALGYYTYTANKAAGTIDIGCRDAGGTLVDPTAWNFIALGDQA